MLFDPEQTLGAVQREDVLGELDSDGDNGHGLPLSGNE
jgi:hypothetical protein